MPMPDAAARNGLSLRDLQRIDMAVAAGLRRATQAGCTAPRLQDAVWELLLEAGDTLRRLPDRERGWLTAASRVHWPDFVSKEAGEAPPRPAPAERAAIDRLDTVLAWLPLAAGTRWERDLAVLLGLACGLRVVVLRRRIGCGRRTIYDVRDRCIARICGRLRAQSAYCRQLR